MKRGLPALFTFSLFTFPFVNQPEHERRGKYPFRFRYYQHTVNQPICNIQIFRLSHVTLQRSDIKEKSISFSTVGGALRRSRVFLCHALFLRMFWMMPRSP